MLDIGSNSQSDYVESTGSTGRRQPARMVVSQRVLLDIFAIWEVILLFGSAFLVKAVYFSYFLNEPSTNRDYLLVVLLACGVFHIGLTRAGAYEPKAFLHLRGSIAPISVAIALTIVITLTALFLLKDTAYYSRVWFVGWFSTAFLLLLVNRLIWLRYLQISSVTGMFYPRILLVGAGAGLKSAHKQLIAKNEGRLTIRAFDLNSYRRGGVIGGADGKERAVADAVLNATQDTTADKVILAIPPEDSVLLESISRKLRLLPVEVAVLPCFPDVSVPIQSIEDEYGLKVLAIQKRPISDWGICLKAAEDYILGAFIVLTFLPAMALIAAAIKLDSRGPVLFKQRRHGFNHEVIHVLKFRTMTVLEDGDCIPQATKHDARVTRLGRFLRRTSLDELPQLFNVLKGDMSLVGPRPHALAHNDYYAKLLDNYAARHKVKPGLTGWAQINGFRGEATSKELMQLRVNHDIEYIENWSLWFDLKILALTPLYGFISRQAY